MLARSLPVEAAGLCRDLETNRDPGRGLVELRQVSDHSRTYAVMCVRELIGDSCLQPFRVNRLLTVGAYMSRCRTRCHGVLAAPSAALAVWERRRCVDGLQSPDAHRWATGVLRCRHGSETVSIARREMGLKQSPLGTSGVKRSSYFRNAAVIRPLLKLCSELSRPSTSRYAKVSRQSLLILSVGGEVLAGASTLVEASAIHVA
jgi:hypothetical protein